MKNYLSFWKLTLPLMAILFSGVFASCSDDDKLSDLTGFLTFGFSDEAVSNYEFTIGTDNVITNQIALPYGFDASSLTPVFTSAPLSTVYMGDVEQASGTTAMDFTNDVVYRVVAENGTTEVSYTVRVNVATDLSAWTNLSPDASFPNYTIIEGFMLNDQFYIIGGKQGPTGYGENEYGIFSSDDGVAFTEVSTTIFQDYGIGVGTATVKHGDKQLLIGGMSYADYLGGGTGTASGVNKVWATTDGTTWEEVNADATDEEKFSIRTQASVVNMDGDLYLTGGFSVAFGAAQGALGDVWKSTDGGATWTNLEANFGDEFVARAESQLLVYNNELYLIGGRTGYPYNYFNEIYKSTDGVNWTMLDVQTPFTARAGHVCYIYNDRFYLLGGNVVTGEVDGSTELTTPANDIWVSEDAGVNWTQITEGALPEGFAGRAGHVYIQEDNIVHIFGGTGVDTEGNEVVLTDTWKGVLN